MPSSAMSAVSGVCRLYTVFSGYNKQLFVHFIQQIYVIILYFSANHILEQKMDMLILRFQLDNQVLLLYKIVDR
jgi:hypothetical protein